MAMPSGATADSSKCPGLYCYWTNKNYEGQRFVVDSRHLTNLPSFIDNKASSMKSKIAVDESVLIYDKKDGNGTSSYICGPGNYPALKFNNAITSSRVGGGC
jgi:hypothetical protein